MFGVININTRCVYALPFFFFFYGAWDEPRALLVFQLRVEGPPRVSTQNRGDSKSFPWEVFLV
jgi:hypothetical protein